MQARLTRKLMAVFLGAALSAAVPVLAGADDKGALQGAEQAAYLEELKRLYLTGNERQALLAHTNALLETRSEEHTSELQSRENLVCRPRRRRAFPTRRSADLTDKETDGGVFGGSAFCCRTRPGRCR